MTFPVIGSNFEAQLSSNSNQATAGELNLSDEESFLSRLQTGLNGLAERGNASLISNTSVTVPLAEERQADEIPPIDQYETTRVFAKFVFDEQARIAREIDTNNGKFTLRGEEYDINKTSGTMQLNFFLTEAQTALGAMQRMLSAYRDWEKRAVEFLG